MEKLTPLLIGLIIFAFKSYQNYTKEQEKTRNRRQPIPPVHPAVEQQHEATRQTVKKPKLSKNPFYTEKIKETNEIQRFKNQRAEQHEILNRKINVQDVTPTETNPAEEFDLRKAVVMSILLDRPYK